MEILCTHNHGVRAGKDQRGVPIVEPYEIRRPAAGALDVDDDSAPVPFANGVPVHQEPVAYRRSHTFRFVRRAPYEKRPTLLEAARNDDQNVTGDRFL